MAGQIPGSAPTLPQGFTGGDSSEGGFCAVPDESGSVPMFNRPDVQGEMGGLGGYSTAPESQSQMAPASKNDAADKGAASKLKTPNASICLPCAANEKVDDLEKRADVKQVTKGKTQHGSLPGDMTDANKEFDNLGPQNVRPIDTQYGPGRVGELPNGDIAVVRPGNSGDPTEPSLDIQRPNGRNTEVRFR